MHRVRRHTPDRDRRGRDRRRRRRGGVVRQGAGPAAGHAQRRPFLRRLVDVPRDRDRHTRAGCGLGRLVNGDRNDRARCSADRRLFDTRRQRGLDLGRQLPHRGHRWPRTRRRARTDQPRVRSHVRCDALGRDRDRRRVARRCDATSDPDLFWACRGGGGGSFGVVTGFTFDVHPIPAHATTFSFKYPWAVAEQVLSTWCALVPTLPDATAIIIRFESTPLVDIAGLHLGSVAEATALLAPLFAHATSHSVVAREFVAALMLEAGCANTPVAACHSSDITPGGALARTGSFAASSHYFGSPLSADAIGTAKRAIDDWRSSVNTKPRHDSVRCIRRRDRARGPRRDRVRSPQGVLLGPVCVVPRHRRRGTRPSVGDRHPQRTRTVQQRRGVTRTTTTRISPTGRTRTTERTCPGCNRSSARTTRTTCSRSRSRSRSEGMRSA